MAASPDFLTRRLEWEFPADQTHYGIPLANGTFGALIWGGAQDIRMTINRADYWDHRGGLGHKEGATWQNLKRWLQEGDEASLRAAFEDPANDDSVPRRPTRLPMGRMDLRLGPDFSLDTGGLDLARAEAHIEFAPGGVLRAVILRDEPVMVVSIRGTEAELTPRPVYHQEVLEHYRKYGFPPAEEFSEGNFRGWVQECPGEPAMSAACLIVNAPGRTDFWICSVFGDAPEAAKQQARELLERVSAAGYDRAAREVGDWWAGYWRQCASISLPDPDRELLYYLGMYKLAGLSWPGGPAATLQGPWVEEYTLPPWCCDYHFNINVQECYWPAYAGNQTQALLPLVEMVQSWIPQLQDNARAFLGIEDGLQLPHAVDDRCRAMGGFWTGHVDHGSTAWTGQLFWLYYRYTLDREFLREVAYPFLKGALRVYEEMLEEEEGRLVLPVSVSPEFGGAGGSAWGRNASFQLANIHFLCHALLEGSEALGVDADLRGKWRDLQARVPLATTDPSGGGIWLWEGQPLSESHRHHSHLAGLYPFDIFDLDGNPEHLSLIQASLDRLTLMGMGLWTGWCMPWASTLFSRVGNGDAADLILGLYRRVFMNHGYASTHDAQFRGFTLMAGRPQIMQIEACLGAASAVMEMLLHTRRGVLRVFPAVPTHWRDVSFEGIRAEGAFLVSGKFENHRATRVEITSEAGAELLLANPFGESARLRRLNGRTELIEGAVLRVPTEAGETLVLTPTD